MRININNIVKNIRRNLGLCTLVGLMFYFTDASTFELNEIGAASTQQSSQNMLPDRYEMVFKQPLFPEKDRGHPEGVHVLRDGGYLVIGYDLLSEKIVQVFLGLMRVEMWFGASH